MVNDSVKIALRPVWRSWVFGMAAGVASFVSMLLMLFAGLYLDLMARGGGTLRIPGTVEWLLGLCFFNSLVMRVTQGPFSTPLFWNDGRVEASDGLVELTVEGRQLRLSRADIVAAWTTTTEGNAVAVLQTKRQTVHVRVESRDAAEALLREAGVGDGQRALSMRLVRSAHQSWWEALTQHARAGNLAGRMTFLLGPPLMGYAAHLLLGWGWQPSLAMGVVASLVLHELFASVSLLISQVHVGVDGVAITRLGQREFVPFGQMTRVSMVEEVVRVELRDGRVLVLRGPNAAATRILLDRMQAAVSAGDVDTPGVGDIAVLERRGRGVREWLTAVKGMAEKAGGYRNGSLDGHDLVALVGDGRAAAEQRIAAAAALSARSDSEVRGRLRIVLEACANQPLRIAIEKALDGELEAAEIESIVGAERTPARHGAPAQP